MKVITNNQPQRITKGANRNSWIQAICQYMHTNHACHLYLMRILTEFVHQVIAI